jgi:hypothetical protein
VEHTAIMAEKERRLWRLASRCIALLVACALLGINLGPSYAFAEGDCHQAPRDDIAGHGDHQPANEKEPSDAGSAYACCFCCVVAPMPTHAVAFGAIKIAEVSYLWNAAIFAGVSIRPDPSPPRPIA